MKKESIPAVVGALILGYIFGIATPKLFPDKNAHQHDHALPGGSPQNYQPPSGSSQGGNNTYQQQAMSKQQMEHVEQQYKTMLQKDPKNAKALMGIANLYFDYDRFQDAINYYQKVLVIEPENSDAKVDMAVMYRRVQKSDQAVTLLQEVIAKNPKHMIARLNLGIILRYDLKENAKAITVWEDFLKVDPDHPQSKGVKELLKETKAELAMIPSLPKQSKPNPAK